MRSNPSRKSYLDLRRIWRDRILNIPTFTRGVRDKRWSRRRRQRAAGGSGDERNSSMILRRFPTHVAVGFAMNRTDWICMPREVVLGWNQRRLSAMTRSPSSSHTCRSPSLAWILEVLDSARTHLSARYRSIPTT